MLLMAPELETSNWRDWFLGVSGRSSVEWDRPWARPIFAPPQTPLGRRERPSGERNGGARRTNHNSLIAISLRGIGFVSHFPSLPQRDVVLRGFPHNGGWVKYPRRTVHEWLRAEPEPCAPGILASSCRSNGSQKAA